MFFSSSSSSSLSSSHLTCSHRSFSLSLSPPPSPIPPFGKAWPSITVTLWGHLPPCENKPQWRRRVTEQGYSTPQRELIKQINEEFRLKQERSLPLAPPFTCLLTRLAAPLFLFALRHARTHTHTLSDTPTYSVHIYAQTFLNSKICIQNFIKQPIFYVLSNFTHFEAFSLNSACQMGRTLKC